MSREPCPAPPSGSPGSTPALSYNSTTATSSTDDSDVDILDDENEDGLSYPPGHSAPTSEHISTTRHSEFGHCTNEVYRYVSRHTALFPHPHRRAGCTIFPPPIHLPQLSHTHRLRTHPRLLWENILHPELLPSHGFPADMLLSIPILTAFTRDD